MSSNGVPDTEHDAPLSETTLTALGLGRQPFVDREGDERFVDEIATEQLGDVRRALIEGDDLLLILGAHGAGKSVLLEQLDAHSGLRIQCFPVRGGPRFGAEKLFTGMLEAFKVRPPGELRATLDELIPCLQAMIGNNTLSVVVLDDAHEVPAAELTKLLGGMLYVNSRDESLLRVALAAPPDFEERLPELLPEGADLPYSSLVLEPFDAARATAYVDFRLERAGLVGEPPFDEREMRALNERAGGLPGALHAVAADALDATHDPAYAPATDPDEIDPLPPELLERGHGGGSGLRLVLGSLAALMILGGLLLFFRDGDPGGDADGTRVAERDEAAERSERETSVALGESEAEEVDDAPTVAGASGRSVDTGDALGGADDETDAVATSVPADGETDAASPEGEDGSRELVADATPAMAGDEAASDAAAGREPGDTGNTGSSSVATIGSDTGDEAAGAAANAVTAEVAGAADPDGEDATVTGPDTAETGADAARDAAADDTGTDAETIADAETANETTADPAAEEPSGGDGTIAATGERTADAAPDGDEGQRTDVAETGDDGEDATETAREDETVAALDAADDAVPGGTPGENVGEALGEDAEDPSPVAETGAPAAGTLESPNWVLVQNPDQYTVQMSASTDLASVEEFLERNPLEPPNSIFSFDRNGRTWYALVHGLYPSIDEARAAIERMPPEALIHQPWIRSIRRVQGALRRQ